MPNLETKKIKCLINNIENTIAVDSLNLLNDSGDLSFTFLFPSPRPHGMNGAFVCSSRIIKFPPPPPLYFIDKPVTTFTILIGTHAQSC